MVETMNYLWNKTVNGNSRLNIKNNFYKGRPIISRDGRIDGGVSVGEVPREAIVVDFDDSKKLGEIYYSILGEVHSNPSINLEWDLLQKVYYKVLKTMPLGNEELIEDVNKKYCVDDDMKVSLDIYLHEGVGYCIHHSLASGVLLERFIDDEIIFGKASVDRNLQKSIFGGGHAWCRYTNDSGQVYILDVAQDFLGTLKESGSRGNWNYFREED